MKTFPFCWPFVRGIYRSPVNSPHKGQWRGTLMFSLICVWTNAWVNNRDADDWRRHQVHYDVINVEPVQAITYRQVWRTSPASQIRVPWRNSQSRIWWINCWWNWRCWRSVGSHRGCTARCQFHPRHRRTPHNPSRNCSDTQGRRTGYRQPQAGTGHSIASCSYFSTHLTHWGRVAHICIGKLTVIVWDNGLSPGRHQAIISTNAGILLIGPLGAYFSEILIEMYTFSFNALSQQSIR